LRTGADATLRVAGGLEAVWRAGVLRVGAEARLTVAGVRTFAGVATLAAGFFGPAVRPGLGDIVSIIPSTRAERSAVALPTASAICCR
jgi:hypothetical protein